MTSVAKKIIDTYMVRFLDKEKQEFINYIVPQLNRIGYDTRIQTTKKGKRVSKNIIAGDIENAHVVFTAHYDTGRKNIFFNRIYPTSFVRTLIIRLIPVFMALFLFAVAFKSSGFIAGLVVLLILLGLIVVGSANIPNKNNANCNTSGVITLYEIADRISPVYKDKAAFVFLDNAEQGFLGARAFSKEYSEICERKLIINLDCVGDGNDIAFSYNEETIEKAEEIAGFYKNDYPNKRVGVIMLDTNVFRSDYKAFRQWINVTAFRRSTSGILYLDNTKSEDDKNLDEDNISVICDIMFELVSRLFFF